MYLSFNQSCCEQCKKWVKVLLLGMSRGIFVHLNTHVRVVTMATVLNCNYCTRVRNCVTESLCQLLLKGVKLSCVIGWFCQYFEVLSLVLG